MTEEKTVPYKMPERLRWQIEAISGVPKYLQAIQRSTKRGKG